MAVYVVSDLHGQNKVFKKGLQVIDFKKEDQLYVIGDAVDRGPDGVEILKRIMQSENMDLLLGNHEFMMLNSVDRSGKACCNGESTELWLYYNGGEETFERYERLSDEERKELLVWLDGRLLIKTLEVGGKQICLTHSYYIPQCENKPFSEMKHERCAWEIVWKSMYRSGSTHCRDVYSKYDYTFITGHVPVQRLNPEDKIFAPYIRGNVYDIDGGCAFGDYDGIEHGAIFLRLDDMKEFCVEM